LMSIFNFIRKMSDDVSHFLVHVAMWGIFAMMLLIITDIVMRAVVNRSTLIAEEVGGYLLVLVAYLAMAETLKQGRHIRVDLFVKRLPDRLRARLGIVLSFIGFVALMVVIWRAVIMVYRSYLGNVIIPGILMTPVYLPQILVIIGLAALALQCIVGLSQAIHTLGKHLKNTG
jgi:TRAP-type C4-dicarboxylate transport system permease small subunit